MLSITHVGWYHVVLTQPPYRRAETLTDHAASQPFPQARLELTTRTEGLAATVSSISGPPDVQRTGY